MEFWQRPEHHVINKRENRRGRADAKRQGQYDGDGKAGRLAQLAQCMPHILEQFLHTVLDHSQSLLN
jgi:hypothetical protein